MASEKRALTEVDRALVQAFVAQRRLNATQLKRALAEIITVSNKLQQGGDDSISVTVNEDDVTQEQIEEYIGIINSELYQLDYEIRCSIDLDNMLVWQLEFVD
ncbi:uncharacterized protein V2V93DRAFT_379167 [Kockiozyma suomiensis]|uniref:uncharacterized protein n=1 Tax=Kockiozyma suomiensis TaxID=1337062 RepID=UPI0033436E41